MCLCFFFIASFLFLMLSFEILCQHNIIFFLIRKVLFFLLQCTKKRQRKFKKSVPKIDSDEIIQFPNARNIMVVEGGFKSVTRQ